MAAENFQAMTDLFIKMHPDQGDYAWAANIERSTDLAAIRGAAARGLQAFDITRWKVKVR